MMYGSWDIRHNGQHFLSLWAIFCPLALLTTRKIKILKKWKINLKILSFYTCVPEMTIIWCMVPEICRARKTNFFCHFGLFSPFPPNNPKNQKSFWKNEKGKHLEISSFYTSAPKIMIICCTVPEIWCVTDIIIFHFLTFYPINNPKNQFLKKMKANPWRYHHFTQVYQKLWPDGVQFLRYSAKQTDRRTEKVTHRGGCPT